MLHMTSFSECPVAGTIRLPKFPGCLGVFTDVDGKRWDIHAIIGRQVCACPMSELHPFYWDTSSNSFFGLVQQEWKPYDVEVVKAQGVEA